MKFRIIYSFALIFSVQSLAVAVPQSEIQFTERVRLEIWDNAISLADIADSATAYTRHRTTLGWRSMFSTGSEFNLKLNNEWRFYFVPETKKTDMHEIVIENLNIKFADILKQPFSITVGRQNMFFDEGFVIADGTPLDGSRTIYFNALRADWNPEEDISLTAFYLSQQEKEDFLPVVKDKDKVDQPLNEQDEQAFGLYLSSRFPKSKLGTYIINKSEAENALQPKGDITTIGARYEYTISDLWIFTTENAFQFGSRNSIDQQGYGGYSRVSRLIPENAIKLGKITLGAVYLSGDDPATTDKFENWNPLYARWPKWSDSYIFTITKESRMAYWSNLILFNGQLMFTLSPKIKFALDYSHLSSFYSRDDSSTFFGSGKTRGSLLSGRLSWVASPRLSGHLLWDRFQPGNYYFKGADIYNWAQIELLYKFDFKVKFDR